MQSSGYAFRRGARPLTSLPCPVHPVPSRGPGIGSGGTWHPLCPRPWSPAGEFWARTLGVDRGIVAYACVKTDVLCPNRCGKKNRALQTKGCFAASQQEGLRKGWLECPFITVPWGRFRTARAQGGHSANYFCLSRELQKHAWSIQNGIGGAEFRTRGPVATGGGKQPTFRTARAQRMVRPPCLTSAFIASLSWIIGFVQMLPLPNSTLGGAV